jgi:preprotein translocase subunit SecA
MPMEATMLGSSAKSDRALLALIERHADILAAGRGVDLPDLAAAMRRPAVGRGLEDRLPEAFGAVCEAYRRAVGGRPGRAFVLAGLALRRGTVAPVALEDDAAVAAMFPASMWALTGGGVHVVTGPSEPAEVVAARIGPVLERLGLSVGVLPLSRAGRSDVAERRAAYAADITVGDYHEFGYDYLRDNLSYPGETVQRDLRYAVVLQADAVLLGDAFTPLVIAGPDPDSDAHFERVARAAAAHERAVAQRSTGEPTSAARPARTPPSGPPDLDPADRFSADVARAVEARQRYRLGEDYLVRDGRLVLLERATGRLLPDNLFDQGIHQAIEDKEGLALSPALQTLAEISVGALFRRYQRLAGVYADPNADTARFTRLYRLPVVRVGPSGPAPAGWGIRRLLHRAGATSTTVPARPPRYTRESDRLNLRYEQIFDHQQDEIYAARQAILHGVRPPQHTRETLTDLVAGLVSQHCPPTAPPAAWDLPGLGAGLAELYPTLLDPSDVATHAVDHATLAALCRRDAERVYDDRVAELGIDVFAAMERQIGLAVIDQCWRKHLADLADLTKALKATDHRARLRRYQVAAAGAFRAMRDTLNREVIQDVFNFEVEFEEVPPTPPAWRPLPAQLEQHRRDWTDPSTAQRPPRPPGPKQSPPPPVGPLGLPIEPPPAETLREPEA